MDNNLLYTCFTMDCEEVGANQGGPVTWEYGERAIRGYCETLLGHGLGATLFVVPKAAERYADMLREMAQVGIEVGLHYHAQDHGYPDYLGAFSAEEQEKMLREGTDQWSQAMGFAPRVFRPGNFSANDATFPTLVHLGFVAGSVSCPLRNFVEAKANWVGAPLYAHYAHKANRLLAGDLLFYEVPVTVDWESVMWGGKTPLELRIEMVDARNHGYTVRKAVKRQLEAGSRQSSLVATTHNIFDYASPAEFRRQVLDGLVAEMQRAAEMNGLRLRPATLVGLR
ncbi:MAG: polysaccharide deacetylase family protein [Anaerolineae bacterium]|nr:polysaccharide deacetylase family protein [Anaerolineae bacterium]